MFAHVSVLAQNPLPTSARWSSCHPNNYKSAFQTSSVPTCLRFPHVVDDGPGLESSPSPGLLLFPVASQLFPGMSEINSMILYSKFFPGVLLQPMRFLQLNTKMDIEGFFCFVLGCVGVGRGRFRFAFVLFCFTMMAVSSFCYSFGGLLLGCGLQGYLPECLPQTLFIQSAQ